MKNFHKKIRFKTTANNMFIMFLLNKNVCVPDSAFYIYNSDTKLFVDYFNGASKKSFLPGQIYFEPFQIFKNQVFAVLNKTLLHG